MWGDAKGLLEANAAIMKREHEINHGPPPLWTCPQCKGLWGRVASMTELEWESMNFWGMFEDWIFLGSGFGVYDSHS